MDTMISVLFPLWIIGAPLAFAVVDWVRTPKSTATLRTTTNPATTLMAHR